MCYTLMTLMTDLGLVDGDVTAVSVLPSDSPPVYRGLNKVSGPNV